MISQLRMNTDNIVKSKSESKVKLANIVLIIVTVLCLCLVIVVTVSAISGINVDSMTTIEFGDETANEIDRDDMDVIDSDEYLFEFRNIDNTENSEFIKNYGG
jgi:hypothetical protein